MSNTAQRIQLILAGWDGKTPITGTINTGPISQGVATIAAEIDALMAQLDETNMERLGYRDACDRQTVDHIQTRRELAEARAEVAKLKPYALVQIAKLKRDSAIEELDGAEDELEHRQVSHELEEWHEMAFRATNLMREQWERDRKTLVRVELGDMVKAACS